MRTDIKTNSSNYTDSSGNSYKKVTTSKTVKVTVGDIIGTAKTSGEALSALKRKASDPTIRKTAVAGLISPLLSFASTMESIKAAVKVSSMIRKGINIAALSSGVAFSPGNVAEIAQIGITAVKKILIAMALGALATMKRIVWEYEIDLGTISNSTLVLLSKKVQDNGDKIKNKLDASFLNLAPLADDSFDYQKYTDDSALVDSTKTTTNSTYVPISQLNTYNPVVALGNSTNTFASSKDPNFKYFKDFTTNINPILNPEVKVQIIAKINDDTLSAPIVPNEITTELFVEVNKDINQYLFDSDNSSLMFGAPAFQKEISPLRTVISKDSIYKIHKMNSVIDWENDLGMQPIFPTTINDLLELTTGTNEYIFNYNDIISKDEYNDLIKQTKLFLNNRLATMQKNLGIIIDSTSIDSTELSDSVSLDDKKKIIDLAASFDDSQKIVSKTLANSYLVEITNLAEYEIKELIAMAIYETSLIYQNNVKSFIININNLLINNKIDKTKAIEMTNEYEFYYNFGLGLSIAFYNYLNAVSINTKVLNKYNDSNLISIAADFYKQEERNSLIDSLQQYIISLKPYNTSNSIKELYDSNINTIKSGLISHINGTTWTTQTQLKNIITDYINNQAIVITGDIEAVERIEKIILNTKNSIFKETEEIKNNLIFKSFESVEDDFPLGMSIDDKLKGYKYLNEIHLEFLKRITELINLSYESVPEYIRSDLSKIIDEKIIGSFTSMSKELLFNVLIGCNGITDESIAEQKVLLENFINNVYIDIPADKILEREVYYFINGIKSYFVNNIGVL